MGLTTGLVHYWKFDNNTFTDSVGSLTFNNTNSVYNTSGRIGGCRSFNSGTTGQYIKTSNEAFGGAGVSASMSFWAYSYGNQASTAGLFFKCDVANGDQSTFGVQYVGTNELAVSVFTVNSSFNFGPPYPTMSHNVWNHVVLVYDATAGNFHLYINNSKSTVVADTSGLRSYNSGWKAGMQKTSARSFSGKIDEIAIWNRALSDAEVTQLYNNSIGFQYPFIKKGPFPTFLPDVQP